jgi:CO/xanthine dehydrogenase FAD-binding subunit
VWSLDGTRRDVAVRDFVTGPGENVLGPGDLLRSITIPAAALRTRTAFRQVSLSPLGRSAAVVIARSGPDGAVVTITAATTRPVQLRFAQLPGPRAALAALDAAEPVYHDDVHGAPAWRAAMTRRFVAEVVAELSAG